jgi:UDP-N-acetylmuramate dehydrogenase
MMNWWRELKGKVRLGAPLGEYTTFKIGGPARFFIEPKDNEDLKLLLGLRKKYKLPLSVIGSGSNILASDKGVRGVVLRLSAPYFNKVFFRNNFVEAASGAVLSRVMRLSGARGLSGLESLAGIPGTLGGALVMNAGVADKTIADLVENVTVMDYNGIIKLLRKKNLRFAYRKSNLTKCVILSVCLKLAKKNKRKIRQEIQQRLRHRWMSQDWSLPSAGCVFKNPKGDSAGRLIDLCGLKGRRSGGAAISLKHANFIVNVRHAHAKDVLHLMGLAKREVKKGFGVRLEPEIIIWK